MYVKQKLNRIVGVSQWIILNVLQKYWVQTTVLHVESDDTINCYYGETVLVTTLEGEIDSDAYSIYKITALNHRTNIGAFLTNNKKPCNIDFVFHTFNARDWPTVWEKLMVTLRHGLQVQELLALTVYGLQQWLTSNN